MVSKVMRIFITITILCFTLQGVFSSASAQDASVVRATQVNGSVDRSGQSLKEGDIVQRGDTIVSQNKSSAIVTWSNGSILEIYPNSTVSFQGVIFEGDKKLEKTFITIGKGRVFVKAQVPEHIFCQFEIKAGTIPIITQGAEFALKYKESENKATVISVIGRTLVDLGMEMVKVEEGYMAKVQAGATELTPVPIPLKTVAALMKTSKRLGGSLLIEEEIASVGGPLKVKIGGVRNRRGDAPYTVKFKAMVGGGSGKIKSFVWSFGDGEEAVGKKVEHTFTQGVYGVIVNVVDENKEKASAQINISVEEECSC